jgi:hypothetical protein
MKKVPYEMDQLNKHACLSTLACIYCPVVVQQHFFCALLVEWRESWKYSGVRRMSQNRRYIDRTDLVGISLTRSYAQCRTLVSASGILFGMRLLSGLSWRPLSEEPPSGSEVLIHTYPPIISEMLNQIALNFS